MRFICLALSLGLAAPAPAPAPVLSGSGFLYKASLVQAAPGRLLEVIELYKSLRAAGPLEGPDEQPLWMRHSQGDRWDLLLLFPIGSYSDYAESADISEPAQEAAARAAGFESASRIGPYLRTLISSHYDTLAVAIK